MLFRSRSTQRISLWNHLNEHALKNHVILGDVNERAQILGSNNTNANSTFDELLDQHGYSIFNDGSHTRMQTLENTASYSAIDVTMGNSSCTQMLSSWTTLDESSSDHVPILTLLNFGVKRRKMREKVTKPIIVNFAKNS